MFTPAAEKWAAFQFGGEEALEGEFLRPIAWLRSLVGGKRQAPVGKDVGCLVGKSQWFLAQSELQREQFLVAGSTIVRSSVHSLTCLLVRKY